MFVSDQIMKGLLDGAILALIAEGETYGYKITEKLKEEQFPDTSEGSIYPVLLRSSKKGYVSTRMVKSESGGPKRKYYSISDKGMEELEFRIEMMARGKNDAYRDELEEELRDHLTIAEQNGDSLESVTGGSVKNYLMTLSSEIPATNHLRRNSEKEKKKHIKVQ